MIRAPGVSDDDGGPGDEVGTEEAVEEMEGVVASCGAAEAVDDDVVGDDVGIVAVGLHRDEEVESGGDGAGGDVGGEEGVEGEGLAAVKVVAIVEGFVGGDEIGNAGVGGDERREDVGGGAAAGFEGVSVKGRDEERRGRAEGWGKEERVGRVEAAGGGVEVEGEGRREGGEERREGRGGRVRVIGEEAEGGGGSAGEGIEVDELGEEEEG